MDLAPLFGRRPARSGGPKDEDLVHLSLFGGDETHKETATHNTVGYAIELIELQVGW